MSGQHYRAERTCPKCGDKAMMVSSSRRPFERECRRCVSVRAAKAAGFTARAQPRPREPADPHTVNMILMGMPGGTIADNLAAMILMPRGLSAPELARRLGVTPRTIHRYRRELRATA